MGFNLRGDLGRFSKMAFVRAADCTEAITRFHRLGKKAREGADYVLLSRVYEWVFVPMSIWPVDVRGLCLHLLDCVESGRKVDERARLLCEYLGNAPAESVCKGISEYEHAVKAGSYESLIEAQYKFDLMETELEENAEFKADWERLKAEFVVEKYQNARGVIRRRRVEERNFRASDWKFSWRTEVERFQMVFDAFCHRWDLYGMERDRPLLLKLSVNLTPFSTMIEVPRYWSFDPKRDLKWGAVTKLHRMREVQRQGPKLSASRAARQEEAAAARQLWREATRAGLKGDGRNGWVMKRLGWDVRTDESRLRRLLKNPKSETSSKSKTRKVNLTQGSDSLYTASQIQANEPSRRSEFIGSMVLDFGGSFLRTSAAAAGFRGSPPPHVGGYRVPYRLTCLHLILSLSADERIARFTAGVGSASFSGNS